MSQLSQHRSERLRGESFVDCDLREVTIRECYVGGLRLVGCVLDDGGVEIESSPAIWVGSWSRAST